MKKLIVFMMFVMIFTQCRKKEEEFDKEETIPVTFELPLDVYRSDFKNLFPDGNIKWGNKNNVEYIYLAVPKVYSHFSSDFVQLWLGEMHAMKAECDEATDKLVFYGEIPKSVFWTGRILKMYYFGNNVGDEENSNVVDVYDELKPSYFIGKKVMFDKQTGDIADLGNYHVASFTVMVMTVRVGADVIEAKLMKDDAGFNTITSVAALDLEGETELKGPRVKSLTIRWNGEDFVEVYEYFPEATYDVSDNAGKLSFIALPPDPEKVVLECGKGKYVFEDGVERNRVYVGRNGNSYEDILPLKWE